MDPSGVFRRLDLSSQVGGRRVLDRDGPTEQFGGGSRRGVEGSHVVPGVGVHRAFSRENREMNLRRIDFLAAEITRSGDIALCAPIAPYAAARRELRRSIEELGGFVEAYVSNPLATCEARDRKGLCARARAGLIERFTGIDDALEPPENSDVQIDTTVIRPDLAAHRIVVKLKRGIRAMNRGSAFDIAPGRRQGFVSSTAIFARSAAVRDARVSPNVTLAAAAS